MSARSRSTRSGGSRRLRSAQLEEQLVRKRQAEYDRTNFWNNNSTYFKTWEFNTSLHSSWADQNSSEHLRKMEELKKKQELLEERRRKLKKLLQCEEEALAEELKNKVKKPAVLEDLNALNIEFILREEEARRRERDIRMHHHWRQNHPCVRDFERRQHLEQVKLSWVQQAMERRKEREAEEERLQEQMREMKRLREEQEEMEREVREERRRAERELKSFLEKQMELAKCKEEQQKILKMEERETMKVQEELEKMLEERRRVEERRKRVDLSLYHKKQYQILIKRRAKEVQENLEYDRKFLEKLANEEKFKSDTTSERASQFRRDLEMARELHKKQLEIEKIRVSRAEYLFDEEAKKMLEEQEAQWKAEGEARQKLMDDVLKSLQCQIKEKLSENLKVQKELQEEREDILRNVEKANNELKECQEKAQRELKEWKHDLDRQILEKKLELYCKKKKEEEEKENILKAKRAEEEKLCQELTKMYLEGYQPKSRGRKNFKLY